MERRSLLVTAAAWPPPLTGMIRRGRHGDIQMSERFFSLEPIAGERVTLAGPEAHHLLHVMRAAVGTPVTLFDGGGAEFAGVVESVRRAEAVVRIVERREIDRELPFELIVGVALPKGDRQKWLVEKLTELGVTNLVPLITQRGVAQPTASAAERLQRSVIESAKQCGRNRLMKIAEPAAWGEWVGMNVRFMKSDLRFAEQGATAGSNAAIERIVAHPDGVPIGEMKLQRNAAVVVAVGPEGGFTDDEINTPAAAGWRKVSLGARILRVETAAVALAAVVAMR